MSDIHVRSGDDYSGPRRLTVTATDNDGLPIDLTGATLTFRVNRRRVDTIATIEKTEVDGIEIATPQTGDTKGVAYIEVEGTDTADLDGRYYWELAGTDAVGHATLGSGGFYVRSDLVHP